MEGFEAATFGDRIADLYDRFSALPEALTALTVAVIAEYANGGPILEVGAGTGRLAIPLARLGSPVTAIEVSPKMVAQLTSRVADSGVAVDIRCVDAADASFDGRYAVVACLFNTFCMVGDRERQRATLRNLVAALAPGGTLMLEAFVMRDSEVSGSADRQMIRIRHMSADALIISAAIVNRETQTLESQDVLFLGGEVRLFPHQMVYLSLAQLDEVCAEAGLELVDRWSDWRRTRYAGEARNAISVYVRRGA